MLALILACWLIPHVAPHGRVAPLAPATPSQVLTTGELPKGHIVDGVVCAHDPNHSYAVYLPSAYSPDRKWPILYAFDPRARGTVPLERFQEAAERYGWIVVGSNNSRNGSLQSSVDAWNALVEDTHKRFALDDERVYATGFSGGARAAIYVAAHCRDCIAGVIACGAGFPAGIVPSPALHFAVFSAIGVEDFNVPEVTDLDDALAKAGMMHRIERFDGRHEWAPSFVSVEAVEWMELRAMQAGTRTRDDSLIAAIRHRALEQARALEDAKKSYAAYQVYVGAVRTFAGLVDVGDIDRKVVQLRSRPDVNDAIRSEQRQIKKQREYEALIGELIARGERSGPQTDPGALTSAGRDDVADESSASDIRLHVLLTDLRAQSQGAEDSGNRRIARRVLDGVFISLYEQGLDFLRVRRLYGRAVRTFTLATEVSPDRNGAFFHLAWAHAANGDRKASLRALKSAVEKGFSDLSAINDNRAFDAIRDDAQFRQIVRTLEDKRQASHP